MKPPKLPSQLNPSNGFPSITIHHHPSQPSKKNLGFPDRLRSLWVLLQHHLGGCRCAQVWHPAHLGVATKCSSKKVWAALKLPKVADEIDWIRWEMFQKYWSSVGCFRFISLERMEGVVSLCWRGWAMAGDITATSWWMEQPLFTWSPLRQRTKVAYTLWWKSHAVK